MLFENAAVHDHNDALKKSSSFEAKQYVLP